jgi:hypothetical protein
MKHLCTSVKEYVANDAVWGGLGDFEAALYGDVFDYGKKFSHGGTKREMLRYGGSHRQDRDCQNYLLCARWFTQRREFGEQSTALRLDRTYITVTRCKITQNLAKYPP